LSVNCFLDCLQKQWHLISVVSESLIRKWNSYPFFFRFLMLPAMNLGVHMDHCLQILRRHQEISKLDQFSCGCFPMLVFILRNSFLNISCSHEYQMIMAVLWKRINDTGKNWRHVYKVCFYLRWILLINGVCSSFFKM
jgi:hypothetical protein